MLFLAKTAETVRFLSLSTLFSLQTRQKSPLEERRLGSPSKRVRRGEAGLLSASMCERA